jgi:hypothetical protein
MRPARGTSVAAAGAPAGAGAELAAGADAAGDTPAVDVRGRFELLLYREARRIECSLFAVLC